MCVCALRYRLACLSPTVCTAHTAGPHSRDCFVPTACPLAYTLAQKHSSSLSSYYLNNSDAPVLYGFLSHPVFVHRKPSFLSPFSHPTMEACFCNRIKQFKRWLQLFILQFSRLAIAGLYHAIRKQSFHTMRIMGGKDTVMYSFFFSPLCLFCWSTCAHASRQIIHIMSEQRIIGIK